MNGESKGRGSVNGHLHEAVAGLGHALETDSLDRPGGGAGVGGRFGWMAPLEQDGLG